MFKHSNLLDDFILRFLYAVQIPVINEDRTGASYIKWNRFTLLDDLDKRLPQCMSDRQFIENIWVSLSEVRYDERIVYSATPFSFRISHTRSGRIGISTCVTPRWDSASTTAFAIAGGAPTVADSPTPFAPSG